MEIAWIDIAVFLWIQERSVSFRSCVSWLSMAASTGRPTRHGSSLSGFSSLEHVIRRPILDVNLSHTGLLICTAVVVSVIE